MCSECRGAYSQEGNDSKQDRLHCYSKIIITDILTIYFFDNDRCAVQHAKVRPLHTLVQKATCITTKCNKEGLAIRTDGSDYTKIMNYASITRPSRVDKRFLPKYRMTCASGTENTDLEPKTSPRFCVSRPAMEFFLLILLNQKL